MAACAQPHELLARAGLSRVVPKSQTRWADLSERVVLLQRSEEHTRVPIECSEIQATRVEAEHLDVL
jgi:hypothetical protein